jgi:ferrous iron transport protein A
MTLRTARKGVSLSTIANGESVRIQRIESGHTLLSRLATLGFTPGAQLQVVQNRGRGPLIVSVRGGRVALGRGEATKIMVERSREDDGR